MLIADETQRPFLAVDRLNKKFGDAYAVKDVSLALSRGEFVTLLGPSGCGKTTTLRCIAGLETPDSGDIWIAGRQLNGKGVQLPPKERHLGMVFQSFAVWPHMTVGENVAYPLKRRGTPRSDIGARVQAVLEMVGMASLTERYPSQLSGGQQQRVALARALVAEPSVLLYDEPLSALDAKLRAQMRQEIRALHHRLGIPGIFVTHDQEEAMELSDRIYVMDHGSVVQSGTPMAVYERPASLFVCDFLGAANMFEVAACGPRVSGGVLQVSLNNGVVMMVDAPANDACNVSNVSGSQAETGKTSTGTPAKRHLVIRPHRVRLGAPSAPASASAAAANAAPAIAAPENTFQGRVSQVTFLGNRLRYVVDTDRAMAFSVDGAADKRRFNTGELVSLSFDAADCILV